MYICLQLPSTSLVQATSFIIILGFLFVAVENYLDTKAIICLNEFKPYPKLYCWIHGYSYIAPNLRGKLDSLHFK